MKQRSAPNECKVLRAPVRNLSLLGMATRLENNSLLPLVDVDVFSLAKEATFYANQFPYHFEEWRM